MRSSYPNRKDPNWLGFPSEQGQDLSVQVRRKGTPTKSGMEDLILKLSPADRAKIRRRQNDVPQIHWDDPTPDGRDERLTIQFTKLVNYRSHKVCKGWGGGYWQHLDQDKVQAGLKGFLRWADQFDGDWVRSINGKWSPRYCRLTNQPDPSILGQPTEMFISVGERLTTISQMADLLRITEQDLKGLKLRYLVDPVVMQKAIELIITRS